MHGGSAPQVRQKAAERIAMAADSAVDVLVRLMHKARSESVRRQAASDLLDRAGFKAPNKTELSGPANGKEIVNVVLFPKDPGVEERPAVFGAGGAVRAVPGSETTCTGREFPLKPPTDLDR
jgi:hypothetical protein